MDLETLLGLIPEEQREDAAELIKSQKMTKAAKEYKSMKQLIDSIGYDMESDTPETFIQKQTKVEVKPDETLLTKVQSLQEALDTERSLRESKEKDIADQAIGQKLNETLKDQLWGAKAIVKSEINKFELDANNKIVGKNGLPFNTVIDEILEEYKEDRKTPLKKGSGIVKETTVKEDDDVATKLAAQMKAFRHGQPMVVASKEL